MIEDGSETLSREETAQLASRQEKFIKHLEDALLRIRNKTYGICRVTGRLISKERLRLGAPRHVEHRGQAADERLIRSRPKTARP
jgi:RNA polymerase-binding transcription factor DksA